MKRRLILLKTGLTLALISMAAGCVPEPSQSYGSKPSAAPAPTKAPTTRPARADNY